MAPATKPAATRQRRNKHTSATTVEASSAVKPELLQSLSHPMTKFWWDTIWASPMTSEWVDADVPDLLALAALVDQFWNEPDPKRHAEIRMAGREFGLSPMSRRSLQWEIKRVETAKPAAPATKPRDPRLRAVS